MKTLWCGNYLDPSNRHAPGGWDWVTVVEFVGELGLCNVLAVPENALPFKPKWYPMSVRGFHQGADIPQEFADHPALSLLAGVTRWNARIPENGAVVLFASRADRDAFIRGDDANALATGDTNSAEG